MQVRVSMSFKSYPCCWKLRYWHAIARVQHDFTAFQNQEVHGIPQDLGVLEEERRWQNLLAQSPSKGDFEFDGDEFMM